MSMDQHPTRHAVRLAIRRDEIAGFGPGAAFATALAVVSGAVIVAIFAGWLWLASMNGATVRPDGGLARAVAWWGALWVVLSLSLVVALWLGFRAWYAAYPLQQRRDEARERRDAIAAAAAILAEHRATRAPGDE